MLLCGVRPGSISSAASTTARRARYGLRNVVRYDTPTIARLHRHRPPGARTISGRSLSTIATTIGDFKVNGAVGYGESTDPSIERPDQLRVGHRRQPVVGHRRLVQHTPTGIYVYGGYGNNQIDLKAVPRPARTTRATPGTSRPASSGSGSISARPTSSASTATTMSGRTVAATELGPRFLGGRHRSEHREGGPDALRALPPLRGRLSSNAQHHDNNELDDFDIVITGAKINF